MTLFFRGSEIGADSAKIFTGSYRVLYTFSCSSQHGQSHCAGDGTITSDGLACRYITPELGFKRMIETLK